MIRLGARLNGGMKNSDRRSEPLAAGRAALAAEKATRQTENDCWRTNLQNAWSAISMIREAVEEFGPVADLEGEDAVLLRGPEPTDAAEAIVDALARVNAALAAEKARGDDAEAECLRIHNEKVDHFMARVAAEAKAERMEAALRTVKALEQNEETTHRIVRVIDRALSVQPEETKT